MCCLLIQVGGIAGTLDANYYKGQGEREGTEREYIVEIHRDNTRQPDPESKHGGGYVTR